MRARGDKAVAWILALLAGCGGPGGDGGGDDPPGGEPGWGSMHVTFSALTSELAAAGITAASEEQEVRFHPFDDRYALYGYGSPRRWVLLDLSDGSHVEACGEALPVTAAGWYIAPFWVDGDELVTLSEGRLTRCQTGEGGGILEELAVDWSADQVTLYHPDGFTTTDGRTDLAGTLTPFDWGGVKVGALSLPPDKDALRVVVVHAVGADRDLALHEVGVTGAPTLLGTIPDAMVDTVRVAYPWGMLANGGEYLHIPTGEVVTTAVPMDHDPRPVMDGAGFFSREGWIRYHAVDAEEPVFFGWDRLNGYVDQATPFGTAVAFGAAHDEAGADRILLADWHGATLLEETVPCEGACDTVHARVGVYQSGVCLAVRELVGTGNAGEPWEAPGGGLHALDCATGDGFNTWFTDQSVAIDAHIEGGGFWRSNTPLVSVVYEGTRNTVKLAGWYLAPDGLLPLHPPALKVFAPFYRPMQPVVVWTDDGLEAAGP